MAISINYRIAGATDQPSYYTPVWKADTTDPVIGNGFLRGSYKESDGKLSFQVMMKAGATTTFGTGNWYIELPDSYSADRKVLGFVDSEGANEIATYATVGTVYVNEDGVSYAIGSAVIKYDEPTRIRMIFYSSGNFFNSANPHGWGTLDTMSISVPNLIVD